MQWGFLAFLQPFHSWAVSITNPYQNIRSELANARIWCRGDPVSFMNYYRTNKVGEFNKNEKVYYIFDERFINLIFESDYHVFIAKFAPFFAPPPNAIP